MVFNPSAIVFHIHPATLSQYLKVKLWRGYWRMIVYRRYPLKAVKDSYTPNFLKLQTMLMALSFFICLLSFFIPIYFIVVVLLWGVVMILAVPFSIKTYKKDKMVGLISPGVILLRSMVFAAGSLMGVIRNLISLLPSK
jgi:Mg2+/citrate symporter